MNIGQKESITQCIIKFANKIQDKIFFSRIDINYSLLKVKELELRFKFDDYKYIQIIYQKKYFIFLFLFHIN